MLSRSLIKLASVPRNFLRPQILAYRLKSTESMQQVDVDDPQLQAQLGKLKLGLIRKAEKENEKRAKKHVKHRKRDWTIGGVCFATVIAVYGYTIWAMQQETFLDDFEVPNPIPEEEEEK